MTEKEAFILSFILHRPAVPCVPVISFLAARAENTCSGGHHLTKTFSTALKNSCHGPWNTNKERLRLLARMATPDKGQKQLGTWEQMKELRQSFSQNREQMEELRQSFSQNMPEKPDPSLQLRKPCGEWTADPTVGQHS